jgi:hypothetical protein
MIFFVLLLVNFKGDMQVLLVVENEHSGVMGLLYGEDVGEGVGEGVGECSVAMIFVLLVNFKGDMEVLFAVENEHLGVIGLLYDV